jgi:alcohol dehydrogenase
MDISFKFDPEILIGADTLSMAGTICSRYGERMMVTADQGMDARTIKRLKDILGDSGIEAIVFDGISEDSSVDMAQNIVELCCAGHCKAMIGFGGPKTQIIARMAAIMAPLRITAFELLDGRTCLNKFLPLISIPTTGIDTFAFTQYFIAADPRDRLVKSVESPDNLYAAMIVDSNLFQSFSGASASISVLGGFCSAVEAYCSTKANFLSDALLERALYFFGKMLKGGPGGINAETYAQAGFLTSLGASVSSPGIGSALSFAVNARYPALKQICGAVIFTAIAERLVSARPEKMSRVASYLGTGKFASVAETANSVAETFSRCMASLNVQPNLKEFSIPLDRLMAAAEAARNLELVSHSPWTVSQEDVFGILKSIL